MLAFVLLILAIALVAVLASFVAQSMDTEATVTQCRRRPDVEDMLTAAGVCWPSWLPLPKREAAARRVARRRAVAGLVAA